MLLIGILFDLVLIECSIWCLDMSGLGQKKNKPLLSIFTHHFVHVYGGAKKDKNEIVFTVLFEPNINWML